MSPAEPGPKPYRVAYSERVRQRLLALADTARERGDGEAFVAAVKDLVHEPGQVWIGFVRPLAMRYGILDERRTVMVAALPVLLAKSAPQTGD